ncbi:16S rRNA (cytidine(1402)-2'-O)-methyltransferase [Candidatus Gottesmanbacteria bacterium RIFCSPHIGHO2_02_FULL_40_13]|uniref:Ribosomal RNA small subunit methyltransferase I n=1 Tax=Candidatus Gottesmanbacteria bacterium RIFCSPHIGHO2_02_FULL_40_13 TaxID=1798384 RepID=A0A1F6A670_9BACT|nr:MAG: 16S rRNA (cytidine(1402)-2'-O)-methyltransferase [Candidatus Gottesmanbacteria bacterium RIFCSPHIGHO2_02_FULL_40_13]
MSTLYVVSTPIGNLEDITIRAIKTLFSVDYIACEDTRRTGFLLTQLKEKYTALINCNEEEKDKPKGALQNNVDILDTPHRTVILNNRKDYLGTSPKLISYYDEIESVRSLEILDLLLKENSVALVSDSGTPLIADPGFKLIEECIKRKIKVVPIPGASAVVTALTTSGLPADKFIFLGYLPGRKIKRIKLLKCILIDSRPRTHLSTFTVIVYESPHRLKDTLVDIKEIFGDIEIVIARELTKIHEEIWRGKISDALNHFSLPKGEFVILFPDVPA